MIPIERSAALLLASGLSRRFGEANKLLAPLAGRPLVSHAAGVAHALPFRDRVAVVAPGEPVLHALLKEAGFRLVENPDPALGRESSLRLGVGQGLALMPEALLVLLGDMPHVETSHVEMLFTKAEPLRPAVSSNGKARMPPLVLPAGRAHTWLSEEPRPLRERLGDAYVVTASEDRLRDYDTAADFARDALGTAG